MVALVCDGPLFVKRTDAGYAFWGEHQEGRPYKGVKPLMLLEEADMCDRTRLVELICIIQKYLPAQNSD